MASEREKELFLSLFELSSKGEPFTRKIYHSLPYCPSDSTIRRWKRNKTQPTKCRILTTPPKTDSTKIRRKKQTPAVLQWKPKIVSNVQGHAQTKRATIIDVSQPVSSREIGNIHPAITSNISAKETITDKVKEIQKKYDFCDFVFY